MQCKLQISFANERKNFVFVFFRFSKEFRFLKEVYQLINSVSFEVIRMDSVPKLLPIWHDIALQDYVRQNGSFFRMQYPPNYGGIGTDVNNDSDCRNSINTQNQTTLGANSCALPFLPVKKIHNLEDPCLGALKREKFEFDKFCIKLTYVRKCSKKQKSLSNIKTLQQYLNTCRQNNMNMEDSIEAPKSLVHLAENLPKHSFYPKFSVAYAGGALAVSKYPNYLNLFHPVAGALNKLRVTPLQNDSEHNIRPDYQGKKTIHLGKEHILQIEYSTNDFCCVRQKSSFHLVNLTNMDIFTKRVHHFPLYHMAVSPYNPMDILSVYEKGMMKLMNIETRNEKITSETNCAENQRFIKTSSISENLFDDSSLIYPTWRCGFGSHLFSAVCMNEKKVYSVDFREKSSVKTEIFCIENKSCHVCEELVAMKLWNKNPYQHLLTSDHHLIISDERYPKKPVLYWNHTLKDPPIYLECTDLDSNVNCIVIGTQDTQELASFLFSHETNIQPISLTPPLLLSSPTDCIESLKLHSYYIDEKIFSRFSSPLSGVCIVPKDMEISFTVLQSTSLGDIFYQDFKLSDSIEKSYKVSTGCVLTPPEKILPHLKKWISDNNDVSEVQDDTDEAITRFQINITKILSPPKEISSNCALCRIKNSSVEKELVFSEICPSCNLNSSESQHFSKAEANSSAIIGPASEESNYLDCDLDYLSGFDDTYSRRILSVWLESEDFEDRQTYDGSMVFGD